MQKESTVSEDSASQLMVSSSLANVVRAGSLREQGPLFGDFFLGFVSRLLLLEETCINCGHRNSCLLLAALHCSEPFLSIENTFRTKLNANSQR